MQKLRTALTLYLLAISLLLVPSTGDAQEAESVSVHWAYSAYFGTGWYRVSGDRDVFVVRMTPRWAWSEASLGADGKRALGIHVKLPVSIGLDRFELDDPLSAVDANNVSFLSVNPGIDIEIPVTPIWSLRPYASVGRGQALDGSNDAWTYWSGIKSRVAFRNGKLNWRLLNQIGFVGYTPNEGPSDTIWPVMAGLEFDYPMRRHSKDDDDLLFHWHVAYTAFRDDLDFSDEPTGAAAIPDQWEIGAALGRRDSPIRIWFMNFDRLGMGYRTSSNGELRGITFVFRSLFDQ